MSKNRKATRSTTLSITPARIDRVRSAVVLTKLALAVVTQPAAAQNRHDSNNGFELRAFTGAYLPTGKQRDILKNAVVVGAQASYRVIPFMAFTGSFGWSPSKDRVIPGDETLDIFQYDLGAEARATSFRRFGALNFTPFIGLGLGGRTYKYRDLDDIDSKTNFLGYGALGGELGFGRIGVRVEGRDYISGFKPLNGTGETRTRNDITVAAGLTLRF
jgi:hypothetical protein